jgi:hypothetical protein
LPKNVAALKHTWRTYINIKECIPNLRDSNERLYSVGINNPLVPKTDTQETENLDQAISLDQEGASVCSLLLSKWVTVAPPYIPDSVVPAPHLGFVWVRGSQSPSLG